jgi:hypothetical protein
VVATSINNQRAHEALQRVRDLVSEHGSAEQLARLDRIDGGRVPNPSKRPVEFAAYQAEGLTIALEIIVELKAASAPRKRGRPRKDAAKQTH